MNIKVRTNISSEFQDIEVVINSPEKNEQVINIENELLKYNSKSLEKIIAQQDNNVFIIDVSEIIIFYSEGKSNYCRTKDGVFRIKEKLYFLEDNLQKNSFIRISNSAIVNIDHVKCFNTSMIGSILIKFKDGSEEYVSRRKVSEVMRFLKERSWLLWENY